jgi:hypothetical protein
VFGLFGPIWVFPISYLIPRFVAPRSGFVPIVGILAGGFVGAWITTSGVFPYHALAGFVAGAFLTAVSAKYFGDPNRDVNLIISLLITLLAFAGIGVFDNPNPA